MSQHDMVIGNQNTAPFRTDLNNALQALVSLSAGATAPSTTYAYMPWLDISATPWVLKIRNAANDAWITWFDIDDTDDTVSLSAKAITASGAILGAAGSLANVAVGRSTDVDTGLIWPAADQLELVAGGAAIVNVANTIVTLNKICRMANIATASLPAAAAGNKGAIAFDTTLGALVANISGSAWDRFTAPRAQTKKATTSGVTSTFSGLPAGLTHFVAMLSGVSHDSAGLGNGRLAMRLGDSTSIKTAGYVNNRASMGGTGTGSTLMLLLVEDGQAGSTWSGRIEGDLLGANKWVISGTLAKGTQQTNVAAGEITLTGDLTDVQLLTDDGTDAFDAGEWNLKIQ